MLIPTPPFPSYTSGHSTVSAAAATVLGHLFPEDATDLAARARRPSNRGCGPVSISRIDNDMGALGGGMIGRLVVSRARNDGAGETNPEGVS